MSNELKPGDRALVVGCYADGAAYNGKLCVVEEIYFWDSPYGDQKYPPGWCAATDVAYLYLKNLIRIPPDSELRQMFRETEKPKEAA